MKYTLVKLTLLAAFDPDRRLIDMASLGDAAADMLRDHGALTVASDYEEVEADVSMPGDDEQDSDALYEALDRQFPTDPVPHFHALADDDQQLVVTTTRRLYEQQIARGEK
jgi:hypothetical protein